FALAGVYPRDWTPVDSLVLQGILTQELDFTTTPLDYALLERSLGPARTMAWFPVLPPRPVPQFPYYPGPYRYRGLAPIAPQASAAAPAAQAAATSRSGPATESAGGPGAATAAAPVLSKMNGLPAGLVHRAPDSNAWAVNGGAVAGGVAMLAGDPHLPQTIPSIWYQAALAAPGLAVTGVTVPGLPRVLIGHDAHLAWSLTDNQNQATLFNTERASARRPGQFFWRGAWHPMRQVRYTIPVRGGAPVRLTVDLTAHGPVLTRAGQTTSVDWMGN